MHSTESDSLVKNMEKLNESEVPELELVEVPKALGDLIEAIIGKYVHVQCLS